MSKSTKNKRKWFWRPKISLRTILLAMVLCALFCWWVQRAETQRTIYNHEQTNYYCSLDDIPSWLEWLPESVQTFRGGHYFRNVDEIHFWQTENLEDEQVAWRSTLPLLGRCREIEFDSITLKDFHFSDLRKARNLEWLSLYGVSIDPESEESFPPFVHLRTLDIRHETFGSTSVRPHNEPDLTARFGKLSKSQKLSYVNISYDAHLMIDQLVQLKKLSCVNLESKLITDEAVKALSGLPLKTLTSDSPLITDEGVKTLSGLPSLKALTLDSPLITDEGVKALSGLPSLKELTLDSPLITDEGVKTLSGLPSLKELTLDSSLITDEAVKALSGLPLKELTLRSPLSDVAAESIAKIKSLKVVQLRNTQITDVGVRHLSTLPNLSKLDLRDCVASPTVGLSLASTKNLKGVDLVKSTAKNPDLAVFASLSSSLSSDPKGKLKQLRTVADDPKVSAIIRLDFSKSDIGDEELAVLKHFSNLEYLDLRYTNVTDSGLNVLKHLSKLETLNLSYTNVTDAGLKSLLLSMGDGSANATTDLSEIPTVKLLPKLRWLMLSGTKAGPLWVQFASQQPNMKGCVFEENSNIDDGCFTDLEEGSFSKLWSLGLSGTSVGNKATQIISKFPALGRLYLNSTAVDDDAIPFLLKSKCLDRLKTFDCRFTPRGIQTLIHAIDDVHTGKKRWSVTQPVSKRDFKFLEGPGPGYRNSPHGRLFVIDSPKLRLEHLMPLQALSKMQGLSLRQCELSVDDLAELRGGYVKELELTQKFCEVPWLESFSKSGLVKVGRLRLHRKDLGIDHLKAIQTGQSLDDLSLSGGNWKTEDMQWLAVADGFSELKHLDFADADISYDVLMGLKNHPALIEIKARNYHWRKGDCDWFLRGTVEAQGPYDFKSDLVDLKEVFEALPDDVRTQKLSFNATNCTEEDWEALTRLKFLCSLTVFGGKLDSTSMDCLARLPFLQSLSLDNVEIDDLALAEFRRLSKLKTLKFIEIELGKLDWRNAISRCKLSDVYIRNCGPARLDPILCPETGHSIRMIKYFRAGYYMEAK